MNFLLYYLSRLYGMTDLTVSGLAVFAVEVGPVAVLVPPGSFVRQGTVSDGDVVVSVFCGEGPALVIAQRVTWDQRKERERVRPLNLRVCCICIWLR